MPLTYLYARTPGRALLQASGDVLLVLWVYAAWRVGRAVGEATLKLAEPGRRLDTAASDAASSFAEAARTAREIPFIGDELSSPLASAGGAATAMAQAGARQVEVVGDLASLLTWVLVAVPSLLALALWVPGRLRFMRRAAVAQRFIDADADLSLFALRAMANQPMHKLARVSDDPVRAWRAGDPVVVRALAALALRDCGLRPPPRPVST